VTQSVNAVLPAQGKLGELILSAEKLTVRDVVVRTENDIGYARRKLFAGKRERRAGWNGKGMHLELQVPDAHSKMTLPYVFMFTADKNRVPWLCSQTDLLATDWEVVA
jgi:hypothetical protein